MGVWGLATGRLSLVPIFGVKTFGADSTCDDIHPGGAIPDRDRVCCMVCFATGVPDHPDLKETASDKLRLRDWEPDGGKDPWGRTVEATTYEAPRPPRDAAPTRRQARAERYGRRSVDAVSMDPRRLDRLVEDGATVMA